MTCGSSDKTNMAEFKNCFREKRNFYLHYISHLIRREKDRRESLHEMRAPASLYFIAGLQIIIQGYDICFERECQRTREIELRNGKHSGLRLGYPPDAQDVVRVVAAYCIQTYPQLPLHRVMEISGGYPETVIEVCRPNAGDKFWNFRDNLYSHFMRTDDDYQYSDLSCDCSQPEEIKKGRERRKKTKETIQKERKQREERKSSQKTNIDWN